MMFPTLLAVAKAATTAAPKAVATLSPELRQQLLNYQFSHKPFLAANQPWLTHTFAGIAVTCAIALIILLAFQTTKQEGLSGTIGGRVESAYKPRLGFDQQLQRITTFVALAFVVFATVVSISGI
jgi:protein translocase SecG subunit